MASKVYSWNEIGTHNTRNDIWVVVHRKVYNITKFLDEHPGGEEVLLEQAGVDATEAFEEIGHSDDARKLIESYYVGDLDSSEKSDKTLKPSIHALHAGQSSSPSKGSDNTMLYILVPVVIAVAFGVYKYTSSS
ncbi:hypothetical protein SeMB42_g01066 [Synchytrium endobioticum]|uniref:Cytochrome b5 heme-binding domain-containing protein n=1 Tax=Synchytrium endobioticum TaxID=286115 RepID=A0A507CD61_9FUNG|nr:hypothetical protein SeLEV6574_g07471 [Synchytrium endobioticum]TPX53000.1 hypothetical protein SeMB42_g01066 [Synchytrium endobioticum]